MRRESLTYIDWEVEGVTVLNLTGRLTLGDGTRIFRQLIVDVVGIGKRKLIVNLAEVIHIDSTGLGELVKAHTTLRENGGKLKLIRLPSRAQALVQLTSFILFLSCSKPKTRRSQAFEKNPPRLARTSTLTGRP